MARSKTVPVTAFQASAPGKVILFGEHAVVYGQPALAVPVSQVQATARVTPGGDGFWIEARDLGRAYRLEEAPSGDPLRRAAELVAVRAGRQRLPAARLSVTSTIPIASGLGSGAAVAEMIESFELKSWTGRKSRSGTRT